MSLISSLYTGTSGLINMGNAIQVTGNNIANVNTVGFNGSSTTFADTLYECVGTQSGTAQVGLGMAVGSVTQNFDQGSLESTGNATDLSIGGDGFFVVEQPGSDESFYTRAGNFYFDADGALVNPEGYIVQGWSLDPETSDPVGSMDDLVLTAFTSPPDQTDTMTVIANLDAGAESNSSVLANSYSYEAGETTTIPSGNYEYQSVVQVYDSLGSAQDVTIMYDKVSDTMWEYIVVTNSEEDNRNLVQETSSQGLLAQGNIEFSESSGQIINMTMEQFTGRVGNVQISGLNSGEDVNFQIEDSEAMLLDGYGIEMAYDGENWVLDQTSLPENYSDAQIVYSDDQNIYLVMSPEDPLDTEPDLTIRLDQQTMAGNTLSFDINDADDTHVQNLEGVQYSGYAANNTNFEILDTSAMVLNAEDISMTWNPQTENWQWSNPEDAAAGDTLVTDLITNTPLAVSASPADMSIINAAELTMTSEDVNLIYNNLAGSWDWNEPLSPNDLTNQTYSFDPENNPNLSVIDPGANGALASLDAAGDPSPVTLDWDGTAWSATSTPNLTVAIVPGESNSSQVQFLVYENGGNAADAAVVQYSFDDPLSNVAGQSLTFQIDPTPPAEYANAQIIGSDAGMNNVNIDFNGDGSIDLSLNNGVAPPLAGGETLSFTVDPDVPPAAYANATIRGDETQAVVDLSGTGNDDILFTFNEDLRNGADTHPLEDQSVISFDIEGSSAWQEVSPDETGYFQFTADFLGGEFGSTQSNISLDIGTWYDGENFVNDSMSTTQYASSSSTTYQDSDGYPPGDLTDIEISSDGVVRGSYSNGQQLSLFMVGLADFNNVNGLVSEGGTLYSETMDSGSAITNRPGENGLGLLASNTLEMSNVDISEEFVSMISLQRAFEANSKIISTVDEMMSVVIQMK